MYAHCFWFPISQTRLEPFRSLITSVINWQKHRLATQASGETGESNKAVFTRKLTIGSRKQQASSQYNHSNSSNVLELKWTLYIYFLSGKSKILYMYQCKGEHFKRELFIIINVNLMEDEGYHSYYQKTMKMIEVIRRLLHNISHS